MSLLSSISPSRIRPALRKSDDAVYDEELGFMDLDNDPDILETISEEIPCQAQRSVKKEDPKVFLTESSKLLEFVKLFPPVCAVRDCGHRMAAERLGHTHMTATLYLKCSQGHQSLWRSADEGHDSQVPQVVQRMFHGALCSGQGFTGFFEMMSEVGFKNPSERAWYAFQDGTLTRKGWIEAVMQVSKEDQAAARDFVKQRDGEEGTVVYADARFDSSRDGYHGTVPVIDSKTGKVLHCVTFTREETGSSWKTENACIRKAFEELQAWEMNIVECVHDDKASVDTILAELGIHSSKDLWHKAKTLCGKFKEELGKAKKGQLSSIADAKSPTDLNTLTVPVLKEYLKSQGLDLKGNKPALIDRVWKHLDKEEAEEVDQDARLIKYPEVSRHKLADKLKTHLYTVCKTRKEAGDDDVAALCKDLHNAADHWAGDHRVYAEIDAGRKCVFEKWGAERAHYESGSATHIAVKTWIVKKCSASKMKFFTRARENFLSETFNSVINKYAPKRTHYAKSHIPRVACAGLDWNEGRDREILRKSVRNPAGTVIRSRGANRNHLSEKTTKWKGKIASLIFPAE